MPSSFLGEENLAKNLGLSLDLTNFLQSRIVDKQLKASVVKETGSGCLSITLEYEPNINKTGSAKIFGGKISKKSGNTTTQEPAFPDIQKRKKKSPSQHRRDRARLHRFLERKKCQKQISSAIPVT